MTDAGMNVDLAIKIESDSDDDVSGRNSAATDESHADVSDDDASGDSEADVGALRIWKQDLAHQLDRIQTNGDFAALSRRSAFVNPGLEVNGVSIPLPLTRRDAEFLKAVCKQAPFGRGNETVVDESVRKTWELDHSQFKLANPAWPSFVKELSRDAADKLGMAGIRTEPYKLLLYEEGSFFRRHKDSEKVAGMIGTLVICLPSKHEGGDVHLSLGEKTHNFSTSTASAFDLTALAWYSDVTHEITKLTSGYRLVLTYNIIHEGVTNPSPTALIKQQADLGKTLATWHMEFPETSRLLYPLEHKYTQTSLSLRNMKGRDQAVCQILEQLCQEHGFFLLLANMTKTAGGEDYSYHGYDEDEDNEDYTLELECVHASNGQEIAYGIHAEQTDIVGRSLYDRRSADSESEGDFTGNESMPSTYRYHDTVAMIVPKPRLTQLLGSYMHDSRAITMLNMVEDDLAKHPHEPGTQHYALDFMDMVCSKFSSIGGHAWATIVQWAMKLQRHDLYRKAVRQAVRARDCQPVIELIAQNLNDHPSNAAPPAWDHWLGEVIASCENLTRMHTLMTTFDSWLKHDELHQSFKTWRMSVMEGQLDQKQSFDLLDRQFLIEMIEIHAHDIEWSRSRLVKNLAERGQKQLLYSLLNDLFQRKSDGPGTHIKEIAREIMLESIEKLKLDIWDFPSSSNRHFPYSYGQKMPQNNEDYSLQFLQLVNHCFKEKLDEPATNLLIRSCSELLHEHNRSVRHIESLDAFLRGLYNLHQENQRPIMPMVQQLCGALFREYIVGDIPPYPKQPRGHMHRPRGCQNMNCEDCSKLDEFLLSETEKTYTFQGAKKRRDHIEYRLPRGIFRVQTDTRPKTGHAHILIVTKINGKEFEEDLKDYRCNIGLLEKRVQPYRLDYVKALLGDKSYNELVMLDHAKEAHSATPSTVAGQKREALDELENRPASKSRSGKW